MNKLIAFCGLDCEKCEARMATLHNDNTLREKVANLWTQLNGVEITADMINCVGCRMDGVKTPFCNSLCPIRKCALGKSLNTCGDCSELKNCKTICRITSNNAEALTNLKTNK
ncbi:MAG: DUF3795 domain-containing protein [Clostridia bacterium]|nr:DUF3795 domain-containing protein [Clostridia bacterium]